MFKSNLTDIGDIAPNQQVTVEWEMLCDPNEILEFRPDCGCTVNTRKEGSKVIADFTESDYKNMTEEFMDDYYPSGKIPITKGIWAYFKDGKDMYVFNEQGNQIINPEKRKEKLTFIGFIIRPAKQAVPQQVQQTSAGNLSAGPGGPTRQITLQQ